MKKDGLGGIFKDSSSFKSDEKGCISSSLPVMRKGPHMSPKLEDMVNWYLFPD